MPAMSQDDDDLEKLDEAIGRVRKAIAKATSTGVLAILQNELAVYIEMRSRLARAPATAGRATDRATSRA